MVAYPNIFNKTPTMKSPICSESKPDLKNIKETTKVMIK